MSVAVRSICYLALDVDGVFNRDRLISPLKELTASKVKELFGDTPTPLQWKRAAAHFFDASALKNFNELVSKIQKVMDVAILLTSEWRRAGTIEELRTLVFHNTGFAHLIVGKTAEDTRLRGEQLGELLKTKENYVLLAIDDNEFDLKEKFPDQFVKIDPNELFTAAKAQEAFAKFEAQALC